MWASDVLLLAGASLNTISGQNIYLQLAVNVRVLNPWSDAVKCVTNTGAAICMPVNQ